MRKAPQTRKEWLILVGLVVLFVAVLSITGILFRKSSESAKEPAEQPEVAEGRMAAPADGRDSPAAPKTLQVGASTFFITPTAAEMLASLRETQPLGNTPHRGENPLLQVFWPGYFSSFVEENNGVATVLLDVDENGFGTLLRCLIKLAEYPEIKTLVPGRMLWVGGKIRDIDLAGDGIITISVELVRFEENPFSTPDNGKTAAEQ